MSGTATPMEIKVPETSAKSDAASLEQAKYFAYLERAFSFAFPDADEDAYLVEYLEHAAGVELDQWVGGGLVFDETYIERTFAMLDHEMGISYYMLRADVDYSKIDPQGRLGSKEKVDRTQTVFCFRTHALLPTCDGLEEGRKHAYAAVTEHRDKKTKRGAIPLAQYKQWKKEASPGLFRFRVLQHIGEDSTVGDVF